MAALMRPVRASMRMRRPFPPLGVTQTEPAPTAMLHGATGRAVGVPTTRLDFGSMRQTAARGLRVRTQTDPSPTAIAKGLDGRSMRAAIPGSARPGPEDSLSRHPAAPATRQTATTAATAVRRETHIQRLLPPAPYGSGVRPLIPEVRRFGPPGY